MSYKEFCANAKTSTASTSMIPYEQSNCIDLIMECINDDAYDVYSVKAAASAGVFTSQHNPEEFSSADEDEWTRRNAVELEEQAIQVVSTTDKDFGWSVFKHMGRGKNNAKQQNNEPPELVDENNNNCEEDEKEEEEEEEGEVEDFDKTDIEFLEKDILANQNNKMVIFYCIIYRDSFWIIFNANHSNSNEYIIYI